jgi:hypothetical protein
MMAVIAPAGRGTEALAGAAVPAEGGPRRTWI